MIVALQHVKKWSTILDHDHELENDDDFSPQDDVDMETESDDDVQDITQNQAAPQSNDPSKVSKKDDVPQIDDELPKGYYMVEAILSHKFEQG